MYSSEATTLANTRPISEARGLEIDNYLSTLWFEGLVETMWCCTDLNISVVSAEKLIEVLHSL